MFFRKLRTRRTVGQNVFPRRACFCYPVGDIPVIRRRPLAVYIRTVHACIQGVPDGNPVFANRVRDAVVDWMGCGVGERDDGGCPLGVQ